MLYQLNKPPIAAPKGCDCPHETSDDNLEHQLDTLKAQVGNYKKVCTTNFGVPPDKLFSTVPLNIQHLKKFIEKNPLAKGVRIYFAKKTDNPLAEDYFLIFVPCSEQGPADERFYEDMDECPIIYAACKKPPGCEFGAALL